MNRAVITTLTSMALFLVIFSSNAATINFDDLDAPILFTDQIALSSEYTSSMGVTFSGTGKVLSEGGYFGGVPLVSPFSSPNYLAFNSDLSSFPPETILFDFNINYFDLDFAGSIGTITITAYLDGLEVGQDSISAVYGAWNDLSLSGMVFNEVVFDVSGTDPHFVVDNLNFTAAVPVPAAIWLFISGLAGLFGIRKLK